MDRLLIRGSGIRMGMCCMGTLSLFGFKKRIINKITFAPPKDVGYHVTSDGEFSLSDPILWKKYCEELDMHGIELEFHWVPTKTHKIACYTLFPKPLNQNKMTLLYSHGNAADIGYCFSNCCRICLQFRINIIVYDYSGYGCSEGSPSEKNMYKDLISVWNYSIQHLSIPPETIIIQGTSIGSATSCHLVHCLFNNKAISKDVVPCENIGGLIIQSGMASGLRIFFVKIKKTPWFDAFCNYDLLASSNIKFPVYIIHGKDDRVIPFENALLLKESIKLDPPMLQTWWVDGANHNNIESLHTSEYFTRLGAFLQICKLKSNI